MENGKWKIYMKYKYKGTQRYLTINYYFVFWNRYKKEKYF